MAYSDFDVEFSTRTQADAATAGGDMVSPPAGVPYQNSGLSDPLTTTGDYCRAIQHNAASQSDASVGQVKMLLANTGSVSAQAFYDVGHDQLISMRLRVRMGLVDGPDAADSANNFLTLAGITAFTSGSNSVYSGGYELVFQVKGSGASRAASVALRASQPVDFSGGVASLLAARTVECSGSYAFDQWYYLRLDLVPVSSTQKTLVAYASADDGVSWSEIGSMTVRSSDPEWSGLSPNRAGIISLRCGEPAATEFYNHFVDGFEARAEAQAANASPSVDAGFSAQSAQEGQVFTYTFPETAFADADGDSLVYSAELADGSALPAWLSFDAATRTFSGTPAAGDVASLTIAVTATDPSGAFERSTFALSVAAANQAPTDIALSASSLYENAAGGTLVGTLSGTDPENDALTFAITGGTGAALFEIVNGTELRSQAGATFDYETTQSYTLDIQASDGQATYSETFTIDVLDVDEVPPAQPVVTVNGDFTLTVDNAEAGATVEYSLDQTAWSTTQPVAQEGENTIYVRQTDAAGNVSTVATVTFTKDTTAPSITGNAAVSVAENTTAVATYTSEAGVVWNLSGTDAALFDLVGGVLSFKAAPDYETPGDAGGDNIYDIVVEATDAAGNKGTLAVAVTVTDANEAPSNLALSSTSVDEGTSGAVIGILSVTDPDADDTIVYTVQSNADKFDVQNGNELVTKVALNYGDATSYSVVLRATDFFGDYVEETFQIDVNNVNYAPTGSVTISGTAQVGETLTASNTLADADGMGTVSYAWFYADNTPLGSGATYTVQASDEGAEIFVRASYTDAQGTAESVDSSAVGPVLPPPPVFTSSVSAVSVVENGLAASVNFASFTVDRACTWSLSGADAAELRITYTGDSNTTASVSIKLGASYFDYEAPTDADGNNVYEVTVVATDAANPALSVSTPLTVTVTEVNEAPLVTNLVLSASSIVETSAGGSLVGTLSGATDPDGDPLTYTVLSGLAYDSSGGLAATYNSSTVPFEIVNGNELRTKATTALDYEAIPSYKVYVGVSDGRGGSTSKDFTITVLDADEVFPVITGSASPSVVENSTVVGTYSADETVTWGLSGTDAALFSIPNGVLSFNAAPDYEAPADADTNNVYEIVVEATDLAGNKTTLPVSVTVTDILDSLVTDQLVLHMDASSYSGSGTVWPSLVGGVDATLDSGTGTPTYSSNNGGYFTFDGSDGMTMPDVTQVTDFDRTDNYTIETWLYLNTVGTTGNRPYILEKWANSTTAPYPYVLRVNSAGTHLYYGTFRNNDGNNAALATATTGQWLHCVGVFDWTNSSLSFYLNGQLAQSVSLTIAGSVANDSVLHIGRNINGSGRLDGRIAAIRTYHKALSSTEVSQNFNFEKSRFGL